MRRRLVLAGALASIVVPTILRPCPAHANPPAGWGEPFPLNYTGGGPAYTFASGYLGQVGYPCPRECPYCNRFESYWRADAANAVNSLSTTNTTAIANVAWPPGGSIVFATAVQSATALRTFMKTAATLSGLITVTPNAV